jgi:methyl-accepting chemotaxis protein
VEDAIRAIQRRSHEAMESMTATESQVAESTEQSNRAGEALQQIMNRIEDMVMRVAQIAAAAEEQSSAAEEINQSIEDIAQVAAEADEGALQAASATRDLAELAQELLTRAQDFQGEGGETRLRSSEAEMKGVLPKLALDFVREQYGQDMYADLMAEMGDPVFLPTASYPDQVLHQMAEYVADARGITPREFFLAMGLFTVPRFHAMYRRHFKDEPLKKFYMRMNDIHANLTKDQPGINPPNFTFEDKGGTLFMNYRSKRGLFDYFEGILIGAARFKGEDVEVVVKPLDATTARAEITFL